MGKLLVQGFSGSKTQLGVRTTSAVKETWMLQLKNSH